MRIAIIFSLILFSFYARASMIKIISCSSDKDCPDTMFCETAPGLTKPFSMCKPLQPQLRPAKKVEIFTPQNNKDCNCKFNNCCNNCKK